MQHVFWIALIPLIVSGILGLLKSPKTGKKRGTVYLHPILVVLGIIIVGFFGTFTVIMAFYRAQIGLMILLFCVSLVGAPLILAFINCRIFYNENGFAAKNFFGFKRKFTYDQVTAIKENTHESYLYMGKKRVMVDRLALGSVDFIEFVKAQYLALHGNQPLPQVQKTKKDIFNGNIDSPTPKFVVLCVINAVFITIYIGFLCLCLVPHSTPENTLEQQISFQSWAFKDGDMLLRSSDNWLYKIESIDDEINTEAIKTVCDGETAVTVFVNWKTSDDQEGYYSIKAILHDKENLMTFDDADRLYRQSGFRVLRFLGAPVLLVLIVSVAMILVGRNAHKLDKRIVRCFFPKDEILRSKSDTVQGGKPKR